MAEAKIIDGKAFAEGLRNRVADQVRELKENHNLTPGLAVVLVGEDAASQIYVRNKNKMTLEAGMKGFEHRLPAETSQKELLTLIEGLNSDPEVHGILVQLPLPDQIDEQAVLAKIDPTKDVDGFHVYNAGKLATGSDGLVPCTPLGCIMMIKDQLGDDLSGKQALVIGRSNIVGKPMAALLLKENCTVTIAHSRTADLPGEARRADILVAAVGRAQMVKGDWVKEGAVVIDVGMNRLPPNAEGKSKLCGDVDFDEAKEVAGAITPVPGGVGPMTIACLLQNTVTAACAQNDLEVPEV
ncbi:MAG: bifunctional methylenetetrahydrofolate dehydrogenase/methenyltetrahydrofolate cyclohydrolase FolD [Rhodospirillaceae bacterium]|jgi:methylenetetrahydrofolate dehydrogenase (NADP+) / methenyltetrahydrofolate cyclohydrolase|nr:bifunctional methylenetetrahydrofolate dehydrogenase/methenyltetrahydrofolate cyclohydrolase FolD [Rhodospirillaceae bacterium]MBT4588236.1 bifunctional methylenetetrahydrofolate dehydrogenase/methenyltetrahydrofolate cyclohydrolase FolD [Rhodospirillaceae bacterium]MBT7266577.1 bifunctional methylenetetrahydrofolate dehydrogenase/methenyltetrahydrofolate cyclohydrolase FolD [Rhodospirillaceae bacterium]